MTQTDKSGTIKVSEAWLNLIHFCMTEIPHGDLKIRIVNSQPTELLEVKRKVRFDKPATLPTYPGTMTSFVELNFEEIETKIK